MNPMNSDRRRAWTRREIEVLVEDDEPEGSHEMFRVSVSPRLMLLLMDYQSTGGDGRVELVSVGPDPRDVALKFFRRDSLAEVSDGSLR